MTIRLLSTNSSILECPSELQPQGCLLARPCGTRQLRAALCGAGLLVIIAGCGGRASVENDSAKQDPSTAAEVKVSPPTDRGGGDPPPVLHTAAGTPRGTLPANPDQHVEVAALESEDQADSTTAPRSGGFDYEPFDLHGKFAIEDWRDGTAYVAAYERLVGDADVPGKPTSEDVRKMARKLVAGAAGSEVGNRLGATVRIAQTNTFKPDSEAVALARAIEAGRTRYSFGGQTKSTYPSYTEWKRILADCGIESRLAVAFRGDTAANERVVTEKRLDVLARLHQPRVDVLGQVRLRYRSAMIRSLPKELFPVIDDLSSRAAVALLTSIPPTQIHDPDALVPVLVAGLRELKIGDEKIDRKVLRIVAVNSFAQVEQLVRTNRALVGYRSAAGYILMHHKAILADALKECE